MEIPQIMSLQGEKDRTKAMHKTAEEMEAQFVYEMLKEMRKTTSGEFFGKGTGSDTYASMFDMEVAHSVAKRGIGLQDIILKGMMKYEKKSEEARAAAAAGTSTVHGPLTPDTAAAGSPPTGHPAPQPDTVNHTVNGPPKAYNLAEIKNNNPYTQHALKFSGPSADESLKKLSRR